MKARAGRPKAINREHLCTEKVSFNVPPSIKQAYQEAAYLFRMKESEFYRSIFGLIMYDVLGNDKIKEVIKNNLPEDYSAEEYEKKYTEMLYLIDSMISRKALNTIQKITLNKIEKIKVGKFQAA